jgi:Domain of unknown function (DUF4430)
MTVTVTVTGGPSVQIPWTGGMNAQNALEVAYATINNSQQFSYGLQYYGPGLGYLVFMMNETYDSFMSTAAPFYYWEFYYNGQPAQQGIDETMLNDGDTVNFTFSTYIPGAAARPQLDAKHAKRTAR